MKKIVFGITVGVVLGFLIFSENNPTQRKSFEAHQNQVENHSLPRTQPPQKEAMSNPPTQIEEKTNELPIESKREVSSIPTHLLDLNISEEQVAEMEENLSDLQKEVSLFRDKAGWVVRFHTENNLLSQIGIKDNDLIRFGQIEKLKQDPMKMSLISRLEDVIENLQR